MALPSEYLGQDANLRQVHHLYDILTTKEFVLKKGHPILTAPPLRVNVTSLR